MSENLFGLTVAADKGLDDLQCQRLLSENRRYQEVMLQYRCAGDLLFRGGCVLFGKVLKKTV